MLQVQGLEYEIGELELLRGIDWAIQPGRRAALIGPNGAGKTTLFRLMIGELSPQKGRVVKPKNFRIGLLPQEELSLSWGTVLESVLEGRGEVLALEHKIRDLHEALNKAPEDEALLERLGELERRFSASRGYELETTAKMLLSGLGFPERDFNRPLDEFSGGWRMRTYLARLLLQEPDLLLLDEPTNHLDLPAIEWLEAYLLEFKGSVVLVSHDRYFIDRLAQEIFELDRGVLSRYPGNYHAFERLKREKEQLLLKKWEEQQAEIRRQERFIERFRAKNTKASQVQSRVKHLEKIVPVERPPDRRRFGFQLEPSIKSFKDVLELRSMGFRYADEGDWILKDVDLHVLRGEKLALVGPNGAGKTTLARLIAGQLSPREGGLILGQRVRIGYYAQHHVASLNLEATVYEEVAATVAEAYVPRIRDTLGVFQFSGDDVDKKIRVLSGGEKARVSLAKILLSPVNFLVMDEPTNHLDLMSREALEEALSRYEGTLLLVSHDRYFLDKLIGRVIELKSGRLFEYAGNYSYYMEKRMEKRDDFPEKDVRSRIKTKTTLLSRKSKEQKRREAEARQRISKERNRLETDTLFLEDEIERLENRKKEIEEYLCRPDAFQEREYAVAIQKELIEISRRLKEFYADWESKKFEQEDLLSRLEKELVEDTPEE
jgi:ATP-binding cassette subfamily F protein 3